MFRRLLKGDPRIIACPGQRVLIVVNYKCGFATFNHELNMRSDIRTRNPVGLRYWREWRHWEHVLFYRDPVERLLSFYNKWIVARTEDDLISKRKRNYYREIFLAGGGQAAYRRFAQASAEEKVEDRMINQFLHCLPGFLYKDGHVTPQSWIYRSAGLTPSFFDQFLPTTETVNFLRDRLSVDATIRNQTRSADRFVDINREPVIEFCREHYAQDYEDLPLD